MPEVQNVGTVDYAQYQPSQYAQEPDYYTDAYNLQPEVYNENLEDISKNFSINKNKGIEFFYDQTKIDEELFDEAL